MSFYRWLEKAYTEGYIDQPPPYALESIQNMEVTNYETYGYLSRHPFRQVNKHSTVIRMERHQPHYYIYHEIDSQPIAKKRPILSLIPKQGINARLWRMWHGLYPTNETTERGWTVDQKMIEDDLVAINTKQKQVWLIPIGFRSQIRDLSPYSDFHEYRFYVGYVASKDWIILQY